MGMPDEAIEELSAAEVQELRDEYGGEMNEKLYPYEPERYSLDSDDDREELDSYRDYVRKNSLAV